MDVQNKIFVSPGVTKLAFWVYPSSPFLTSVLPLVEDLEVHDSGQSADNQLIALGSGLWSFEDSHSGPVIPVQVILRRGFKASKKIHLTCSDGQASGHCWVVCLLFSYCRCPAGGVGPSLLKTPQCSVPSGITVDLTSSLYLSWF